MDRLLRAQFRASDGAGFRACPLDGYEGDIPDRLSHRPLEVMSFISFHDSGQFCAPIRNVNIAFADHVLQRRSPFQNGLKSLRTAHARYDRSGMRTPSGFSIAMRPIFLVCLRLCSTTLACLAHLQA